MRHWFYLFPAFFVLCGCAATHYGRSTTAENSMLEWTTALNDVQQEVHRLHINLDLLEEQVKKQESAAHVASKSPKDGSSPALDKKIAALEADVRQLSQLYQNALSKIQGLEQMLTAHETRFNELTKLKGTLHSISQAIGNQNPSLPMEEKIHTVQSGESLEKIAKKYQTTVAALKQLNNLTSDKIVIKQTLKIPRSSPQL